MAFLESLLCESCQTTSPGERPGVPQETVPQEWLAAPASLGLLARLLAAVPRATHEEKNVEHLHGWRAGAAAGCLDVAVLDSRSL